MNDFGSKNKPFMKKIVVIVGVIASAVVSAIFATSLSPARTVTSENPQQNIVVNGTGIAQSVGFYFRICGDEVDPLKTLGNPEDPIIAREGEIKIASIAFCRTGTSDKNTQWSLKLESGDHRPIRTTKTAAGKLVGSIAKGVTVTLDTDFIYVAAAQMDATSKTVKSPSTTTFNLSVDIAKDAEQGKHAFFVFASKPDSVGGYMEIGKPVVIEVTP